ncbi:TetR/AcrR family transcriptional regulator [Octadecabacter ascidiaceicola]|uniref:HTH-type transcriptional regulator AcrR n=1 Tax=Octadecabacter ascidiaceicola TaxID=1655543 RepID=A0A238KIF6_9RHOB|nr:TetR/AcrR family transcriptional regulator [Octadecabacter ascidiaceicola]SMX42591.1 HTH-type transcriptional regulator AcrR [Octadecabacter ascidiaceicola]
MVRSKAKDHDSKRQHILTVAAEVFAREGIARASMSEVARASGISKANIYHYYDSKDELIFDILDTHLSQLRNWVCGIDLSGQTPAERLHTLTREFLLAYDGMDNEHKIQSEGLPHLEERKQGILKGYQHDLVDLVKQVLRDCAPETLGQDETKCRDVTMSVFGMLNWLYMWNPDATKDDRIAYAATVADLALYGLQSPASA